MMPELSWESQIESRVWDEAEELNTRPPLLRRLRRTPAERGDWRRWLSNPRDTSCDCIYLIQQGHLFPSVRFWDIGCMLRWDRLCLCSRWVNVTTAHAKRCHQGKTAASYQGYSGFIGWMCLITEIWADEPQGASLLVHERFWSRQRSWFCWREYPVWCLRVRTDRAAETQHAFLVHVWITYPVYIPTHP